MNSFKEKFKIAKILASLFTHSSTPEEKKNYHAWLDENPEHQKIADRILNKETYEENSRLIKSFSSQKAWDRIYPLLGGEKTSGFLSWKRSLKYAALLLLLLIPISYLIYNWVAGEPIGEITPGTHGGELTLSNGNTFNLFENVLPEGATEVFIIDSKAESQLTYPICFSDKERIVQVEGEAYFDVAPDKAHPFIVQTPHTSIRVTGTSFNVRAYADEEVESTTLISGAIEISSENEDYELIPNQHFVYDKNSRESTVSNVNTELYTSWESGSFIFMNVPLENVMSYLSKWYGFTYTFEDDAARQVQIGAYLNRYANMNPIIDMIMELNMVDIKQREGILHISYKQ